MRTLFVLGASVVAVVAFTGCGLGGPCGPLSGSRCVDLPGPDGSQADGGSSRRAFVTSASYSGDLQTAGAAADGLAGADALCAAAARATNLGGSWKAWLSAGSVTALGRITDVGPWRLVGGEIAFNNASGLAGTPLVPLDRDEAGRPVQSADYLWTGTESGGSTVGGDCLGWSSASAYELATYGYVGSTTSEWTSSRTGKTACSGTAHLLCLEQ